MSKRYPHIASSDFPDAGSVNAWKYDNENDYSRWDNSQMRITVCAVPWDLGEAHIGNRTIEGVGNVVAFEDEAARNAYFDGLDDSECYRFTTKYRRFHDTDEVKVPIPVTSLGLFNYIEVLYFPEPGTGDDLAYTSDDAIERWYYFIRSIKRGASNTSICTVMMDVWQTCIYRIDIANVYLERGHWPLAEVSANDYLANPIEKAEFLLGDDLSFGDARISRASQALIINDDVWLCIVTTGDAGNPISWGVVGNSDWKTPVPSASYEQGAPAPVCFAIEPSDFAKLLATANEYSPQFSQTVKGVFFAPKKLVYTTTDFVFLTVTCHFVAAGQINLPFLTLEKSYFGFDAKYADLAKLYTYPYSLIEVTDETGRVTEVRIEETSGTIQLSAAMQLVFPWIRINAHLDGIGGSVSATIRFENAETRTFYYAGRWYDYLMSWDVPIFSIAQSSADANFSTYWDRQQTMLAAANTQTSENASANLQVTNAGVQGTANAAINSTSNTAATRVTGASNSLNQALQAWNAGYSLASVAIEVEGQQQQAAIGAAAGVIGSVASGAASGGPIGAVGGLISGAINAGASMASTAISANMAKEKVQSQIYNTQQQVNETNTNNDDKLVEQVAANTTNTQTNIDAANSIAANSAAIGIANAARSYATASSSVANQVAGAAIGAPLEYGTATGGELATARPMAAFANIVTQSDAAIAQAGDMFLRYGYKLARWVPFGGFVPMEKFAFWQVSDMTLVNSYVPDAYVDQLRLLLFGGVTVWKDPADIGHTTIYENGV